MSNSANSKLLVLLALVVPIFTADAMIGNVIFSISELWNGLIEGQNSASGYIIWQFRIPKALTALSGGAAIAVSGLLMQTFFRNPMAGPFVLGISGGASLGVALLIMLGTVFPVVVSGQWGIIMAAMTGSMLVMLLVVAISAHIKDSVTLLIIGLMVGSFTSAIVSLLQYFSSPELLQAYLFWTFGNLSSVDYTKLVLLLPILLVGLIISFLLRKQLNLLLLGEQYAVSMGLRARSTRIMIVLATGILAGSVTAFCGPVSFLGLAAPHAARKVMQSSDHKVLLPATALLGSIVLLLCDLLSQLPGNNFTLPVNAITSILGAPVVIWLIMRRRSF